MLRSGGADGADLGFRADVPTMETRKIQVFLPWRNSSGMDGEDTVVLDRVRQRDAMDLVGRSPRRGNPAPRSAFARGEARPSSVTGFRVGCQKFDLYKFGKCGITLA